MKEQIEQRPNLSKGIARVRKTVPNVGVTGTFRGKKTRFEKGIWVEFER